MPACSWVCSTTRVASTKACSDGNAVSQSGTGYEPTTVVSIRGFVIIVSEWLATGTAACCVCARSLGLAKYPTGYFWRQSRLAIRHQLLRTELGRDPCRRTRPQ